MRAWAGALVVASHLCGCGDGPPAPTPAPAPVSRPPAPRASTGATSVPDALPRGLVIAASRAGAGDVPAGALLELVTRSGGAWARETLEDPDSDVLHHARCYDPEGPAAPGILTLGGGEAVAKLWRRDGDDGAWRAEELWRTRFGPRSSRMRDVEVGRVYGAARTPGGLAGDVLVIGTHDEGVIATASPRADGTFAIDELDRRADTLVHEIELGDLDGDGTLEIYASTSPPNALIVGIPQPGQVVRYAPAVGRGRSLVVDLAPRHAKELLVDDVDGDGRDELYVVVEALTTGTGETTTITEPVEIRRYDARSDGRGVTIATIPDRFTRFLVAGDLDGDGRRELVASAFSTGLWLLTPTADPRAEWGLEHLDAEGSGFEHAALLADLDEDGRDELYVADDPTGELRRYVWEGRAASRDVILRAPAASRITWSLSACPRALLTPGR